MTEVVPAIIPKDLSMIEEMLGRVVGLANKAQIDIVDGKYADAKTWPFLSKDQGDELLKLVRNEERFPFRNEIGLELDMLTLHPIEFITDFIDIGFKSFVVHIDSTDHVAECIETINNAGCSVGLGIRPSIDTNLLIPHLPMVQFVQFMGNDKVGHNGVELDPKVLDKIDDFHKMHPSIELQIDIGVNFDTAKKLVEVGITRLISGSSIFSQGDPKENIARLANS